MNKKRMIIMLSAIVLVLALFIGNYIIGQNEEQKKSSLMSVKNNENAELYNNEEKDENINDDIINEDISDSMADNVEVIGENTDEVSNKITETENIENDNENESNDEVEESNDNEIESNDGVEESNDNEIEERDDYTSDGVGILNLDRVVEKLTDEQEDALAHSYIEPRIKEILRVWVQDDGADFAESLVELTEGKAEVVYLDNGKIKINYEKPEEVIEEAVIPVKPVEEEVKQKEEEVKQVEETPVEEEYYEEEYPADLTDGTEQEVTMTEEERLELIRKDQEEINGPDADLGPSVDVDWAPEF